MRTPASLNVPSSRRDSATTQPSAMNDMADVRAVLEANLATLKRIISLVCARHRCFGSDAEDFAHEVIVKLLQGTVLQGYRGDGRLDAYLTVVVVNCFRDFRTRAWGKWRPSARAVELGPDAVRLEQLTVRDGFLLEEAVETLVGDPSKPVSRETLLSLAERLPPRLTRRMVGDKDLESLPAASSADELVAAHEERHQQKVVRRGLTAALAAVSSEDRSLLQLRFWEGISVADLARMLGVPQRSCYSRFDSILRELRIHLERCGLSQSQIRETLGSWCESGSSGEADE
jgi:RNA polymerase sigma factor (sigma-70 family)